MEKVYAIEEDILKIRDALRQARAEFAETAITDNFPDAERMRQNNLQIMDIMIDALTEDEEVTLRRIADIATVIGEHSQEVDYTLEQAITDINDIRQKLWIKSKKIMVDLDVHAGSVMRFIDMYNPLIDQFTYSFSKAYIEAYEKNLEKAETEFLNLSAPVVPILDGVAVLPVIGTINENRAELLMQTVLKEAANLQLDHIFIDLSGVTLIDTTIAHYLFEIVTSLEVVGVSTVLIGIRPEISQTMVSLGVDFSQIETYHSLQQALKRQGIFERANKIK